MLEISLMLTISTAHISERTAIMLKCTSEELDIPIYTMGEYGWLVYVSAEFTSPFEDLNEIAAFARQHNCTWVRLDPDGHIIDDLLVYDW